MAWIARRNTLAGLVALGLGIGGAEAAQGQAALLGPGAAYVGGGVSGIATEELDERLAARGYPTFGGTAGAVTLGAYRVLRSGVMLGGEFNGLVIGEAEHQGRDVWLGG